MRRLLVLSSLLSLVPAQETKVDFVKQVVPILVQRCVECHGTKEQKGDLRLDRRDVVFADGKSDEWVVQPGKPGESELVNRIKLPAGDEDVMPAEGEPLRKEQIELIERWIAEGADWPVAADAVIEAAENAVENSKVRFDLPALDDAQRARIDAAIAALQKAGAVAQRVAADTEAVDVNLSLLRDRVGDEQLAMLADLAPVLVWLNLSRTKVTDAGLAQLAGLPQLRRLHLAGTGVGDAAMAHLQGLTRLEYLNLYGTKVGDAGLASLAGLTALRRLYVWETAVTGAAAEALQGKLPRVAIDRGDYVETRLQAAQAEIAARATANKPVNATCPVSDKPVDPAHAIDHEGIRIGFCCEKCQAQFQQDPAKFAAKVAEYKALAAGKPVNENCPVSGKPVDPAFTVEHQGRRIGFCCGDCRAKFLADPAAFADKLPK